MKKVDYENLIANTIASIGMAETVKFFDHLTFEREDSTIFRAPMSVKKSTSSYSDKNGTLQCDGYSVMPYITKHYSKDRDGNTYEDAWNFAPNQLYVKTNGVTYKYVLCNGNIAPCKIATYKQDSDTQSKINGINSVVLQYLTAKKVTEIEVEKELNKILVNSAMKYDNAYLATFPNGTDTVTARLAKLTQKTA